MKELFNPIFKVRHPTINMFLCPAGCKGLAALSGVHWRVRENVDEESTQN